MQSNRLMRSSMDVTVAERAFDPFSFAQRHIGPQAHDVRRMLQVVNVPSVDALIDEAMPGDIRQTKPLSFGSPLSESERLAKMRGIAARNQAMVSLIGQGYHAHTAFDLADEEWKRLYSRALGCYPAGPDGDKYWCPLNRIDNAYGDRNLICNCSLPAGFGDDAAK